MRLVTTDAIVLRSYNLAESDRIVLCLTRTAGLIRGVAKGARRMKSRFGAALEPFTLVKLAFYEKENRELVTISTAEILKSRFDLAAEIDGADVLAYIGELVSEFAPPHEANEKMFRMVAACIDALAALPHAGRPISRYFEVWLLRLAGLFPDVRSCGECGKALGNEAVYLDAEGKLSCQTCSRGRGESLLPETRRILVASQRLAPLEFANSSCDTSDEAAVELAEFTHRLIVRALERRPRTQMMQSHTSPFVAPA